MPSQNSKHPFSSPVVYLSKINDPSIVKWEAISEFGTELISPEDLIRYQNVFSQKDRVFVFEDAKPHLRHLLEIGIDVARPVCLKTLETLLRLERANQNPLIRLAGLLDEVEALDLKALARLESLVLRPFAAMENRGLYIHVSEWKSALNSKEQLLKHAQRKCEDYLAPHTGKDLFGAPTIDLNHTSSLKPIFEKIFKQSLDSFSNEALRMTNHPLAIAYIDFKEASKLISTYGERFLEYVDLKSNRIHADFNSLGTSTGRVSCQKPNIQNLPSDPAFAKCLVAPEGRGLVKVDFSSCELRVLAGLAKDQQFLSVINSRDDFHSAVATRLFKTKVSKLENTALRERAKAINFGIIYGMGVNGLAKTLQISTAQAQEILDQYFLAFPGIQDFLENCVSFSKEHGYAKTILGRRLYFSQAGEESIDVSRIAKNMPIQGSAAELAKLAMIRVHERLTQDFPKSFLVNMIHDELVIECPASEKDHVAFAVKDEMIGAQEALFPFVRPEVDVIIS